MRRMPSLFLGKQLQSSFFRFPRLGFTFTLGRITSGIKTFSTDTKITVRNSWALDHDWEKKPIGGWKTGTRYWTDSKDILYVNKNKGHSILITCIAESSFHILFRTSTHQQKSELASWEVLGTLANLVKKKIITVSLQQNILTTLLQVYGINTDENDINKLEEIFRLAQMKAEVAARSKAMEENYEKQKSNQCTFKPPHGSRFFSNFAREPVPLKLDGGYIASGKLYEVLIDDSQEIERLIGDLTQQEASTLKALAIGEPRIGILILEHEELQSKLITSESITQDLLAIAKSNPLKAVCIFEKDKLRNLLLKNEKDNPKIVREIALTYRDSAFYILRNEALRKILFGNKSEENSEILVKIAINLELKSYIIKNKELKRILVEGLEKYTKKVLAKPTYDQLAMLKQIADADLELGIIIIQEFTKGEPPAERSFSP